MTSNNLLHFRIFFSLVLALVLTGCGGDGDSNGTLVTSAPALESENIVLYGQAVKGPFDNSVISVFELNEDGLKSSAPLASTYTDPNGNFTITLANTTTKSLALVLSGGAYNDEATGQYIRLRDGETLEAFVRPIQEKKIKVNITPLTTLAAALARSYVTNDGRDLRQSIIKATDKISFLYGVNDVLTTPIPNFSTINTSEQPAVNYALLLAGFSQLDREDDNRSAMQIIAHMAADLEQDGIIGNQEGALSPSDLVSASVRFLSYHPGVLDARFNDQIRINGTPSTIAREGALYSFYPDVTDFDIGTGIDSVFTFYIDNRPQWAEFDTQSGALIGIPTDRDVGIYRDIMISVVDGDGEVAALPLFDIRVEDINNKPTITSTPETQITSDQPYAYQVVVLDLDSNTGFTYRLVTAPSKMTITHTGLIAWTPSDADLGEHLVTIEVVDSDEPHQSATQQFTLVVASANDAPVINSIANTDATEGQEYSYQTIASDPDGDNLAFALDQASLAQGMSINRTGLIRWTPSETDIGEHVVTITATDDGIPTRSTAQQFTLTVAKANDAPIITSSAPTNATQEEAYAYQIVAFDADGDDLSFLLDETSLARGLSITDAGLIGWTPSNADVGQHQVTITVTDNGVPRLSASQQFTIVVANVNDTPVITSTPNSAASQGQLYTYQVSASDPDNDTLSFALDERSLASGLAITNDGMVNWIPTNADVGDHPVVITVTDSGAPRQAITQLFTISVQNVNDGPSISSTAPAYDTVPDNKVTLNGTFTYQVDVFDPDTVYGDVVTFSLDQAPSGMNIDQSGLISWKTTENVAGNFPVTVRVTDKAGITHTQTLSVLVVIPRSGWSVVSVDSEELLAGTTAESALDGDINTIWLTEFINNAPPPPHELQIDLGAFYDIEALVYLPYQALSNGRVDQFDLAVSDDGNTWTTVHVGRFSDDPSEQTATLGSPTTARYLRMTAWTEVNAKPWTSIAELNLIGIQTSNVPPNGIIDTPSEKIVTVLAGEPIVLEGHAVDQDSSDFTYSWDFGDPRIADSNEAIPSPIRYETPGTFTVTFSVTDDQGRTDPSSATRLIRVLETPEPLIPQTNWSLHFVDSEETNIADTGAINAFDGDHTTLWFTQWWLTTAPPPHELQINLGGTFEITGFRYLPSQLWRTNGRISEYAFYVSEDGANWTEATTGTFPDTKEEQLVTWTTPISGRFVRLVALTEVNGNPWTAIAELNVLGTAN